jgi:hypothetical protein
MLEKRPLVCFTDTDGKYVVLGGNMRLKASKELKLTELPIILADDWTEEQKNEFLIKDNVGFGEWDWDGFKDGWDVEQLEEWGLEMPIVADNLDQKDFTDEEFNEAIGKINDENCKLPITPIFHEKYSYFIILCENEIDEQFIRNTFDLNEKHTSHKNTDNRLSNIISVEKIQEVCLK